MIRTFHFGIGYLNLHKNQCAYYLFGDAEQGLISEK